MTQKSSNPAPRAFRFPLPWRAVSLCALLLYFINLNINSVFFQLRGVQTGHYLFSVLSAFAGGLAGGLLMDAAEKRGCGRPGTALRLLFPLFLAFPGLFGLVSFAIADFSGNLFLNAVQPGLWMLPLAPALRQFFRHEPSGGRRAVWLGLAFGAGHLCWSLLLPFARVLMQPGRMETDVLTFLNLARCLLAFILAYLIWKALAPDGGSAAAGGAVGAAPAGGGLDGVLSDAPHVHGGLTGGGPAGLMIPRPLRESAELTALDMPARPGGGGFRDAGPAELTKRAASGEGARPAEPGRRGALMPGLPAAWRAALLLLAFLPCVLLNGTLGFVLFARSVMHGSSPELIQLGMAFLFPLAGLWLARSPERLRPLMAAFVLCFALSPLLLPWGGSVPFWLRQAALALCIVGLQGLYFSGTLYMASLGPFLRLPSLALMLIWFIPATALSVPGIRALLGAGAAFNQWLCLALALCCLGSALLARRLFPVPDAPGGPAESAPLEPQGSYPEEAGLAAARLAAENARLAGEAKFRAFAAAHDLSSREAAVLSGLLEGLDNDGLAARLEISARTVRHHLGGLLRKSGAANRRRLLHLYTGWQK